MKSVSPCVASCWDDIVDWVAVPSPCPPRLATPGVPEPDEQAAASTPLARTISTVTVQLSRRLRRFLHRLPTAVPPHDPTHCRARESCTPPHITRASQTKSPGWPM